jgi:hypothetical protein
VTTAPAQRISSPAPSSPSSPAPRLSSLNDLGAVIDDVVAWTRTAKYRALPGDAVPGTTLQERRALAALGALVAKVISSGRRQGVGVPDDIALWLTPEPLASAATSQLSILADRLRARLAIDGPVDALAAIYEGIIAGPNRRHLGTFFTPAHVVRHMLALCETELPSTPSHIIDPGAGVGAFTLAAPHSWPGADIHAVDINVVTLGMLLARPTCAPPNWNPSNIRHELGDFLSWITTSGAELAGPRLFLGNPPYTRVHDMSPALRASAFKASGDLVKNRLAGLSTHFTATILRNLRPIDSTCLLIPGNWCYTNYGADMRSWLWAQKRRSVRLAFFPVETEVFPGTRVTAMTLFVGPEMATKQPFVVERLNYTPTMISVESQRVVSRDTHAAPRRFDSLDVTLAGNVAKKEDVELVPLGDLVTTRRGTATGANHFFFVDDPTAERLGRHHFVPAVTRATHIDGADLTRSQHAALARIGHPAWLLKLAEKPAETDPVAAYLEEGENEGLKHRYLIKGRSNWWNIEEVAAPDLLLAPFTRDRYRFIVNSARAVPSNNLYGLTLKHGCKWTAEQLAEYLSSDDGRSALQAVARQYQGGSFKLEPKEMLGAMLPANPPTL